VRLIDPRGSFGRSGIYGDARSPSPKPRHGLSGLYDFVMADARRGADGSWTPRVQAGPRPRWLAGDFDRMVAVPGCGVSAIRFIEGLLFVSRAPCHHGHPLRQQLLYPTGFRC
jgi:hypothetical protein